jgi:glycosyltransferase involved in cell wall biosynthesis
VNSERSRQALEDQGVDPGKVEVLSLGYDSPSADSASGCASETTDDQNPLTIVWLGSASIRKGIQYFVEAARGLQNDPFQFIVAGSIDIRKKAVQAAPENIEWKGHIPHSEVPRLLRTADVHVLPTLSDGFGMTQIEALAHGTPVIATRNCGHVIDDGKTGLLIEPRSVEDLVNALLQLENDRALLARMRSECVKAASRYSIDAYGRNLTALLRNRMPQVPDGSK